MARRVTVGGLVFLVGMASGVEAQEVATHAATTVFEQLEGTWEGSGTLMGRPGRFRMRWEIGDGGFVRLSFTNGWAGSDGTVTPVLSSEAVYLVRGRAATGIWLDSRPQRISLTATLTDSSVITEWAAEAEEGRTEYEILASGEVAVRDFVYGGDGERLFAEANYRRVTPGVG